MTDTRTTDDPAAIERDIRRTQDDMSRTVDKIGNQLTPKNIFNALLDKADENGVDAHYLVEGARRNPLALGLIAAGAIWLVSDKDSKFPSMPGGKAKRRDMDDFDYSGSDVHHRDYVTHMSAFEMSDGEDQQMYQQRRDVHRANFLMCERQPDEDDHSFRGRLDDMTEQFRQKRSAWSDSAGNAASEAQQRAQALADTAGNAARQASDRAQLLYDSNPLVGGILAAAVGAALGSAIPVSRQEKEKLGGVGAKALDAAKEERDDLTSMAMEKKDELLDKADDKLRQEPRSHGDGPETQSKEPALQGARTSRDGPNEMPSSGGSFIVSGQQR